MRIKGFPKRHPNPTIFFDVEYGQLQDLRQIAKSQCGTLISRLEYFHRKFHDLFFQEGGKIVLIYWTDVPIMGEDVFKFSNLDKDELREALFIFEEDDTPLKTTIDKKLVWYRDSLLDLFDIDLKPLVYIPLE